MYFKFKQFAISQSDDVFKFGTDAALLATWASISNVNNVLEIGCGTGVISLMLAQRNPISTYTGIDLSDKAVLLSKQNASNSPFPSEFYFRHTSLQDFTSNIKFDLIVSNPPFFNQSTKSSSILRNNTRHNDTLSLFELLCHSKKLLGVNGRIEIIYPFRYLTDIKQVTSKLNLFINSITYVKGRFNAPINRVLISISMKHTRIIEDEIHVYGEFYGYSNSIL